MTNWPSVPFGDVFEIQLGKMLDKRKNVGELRPYLANRNVQWGKCDLSDLGQMRFTEADRQKFRLQSGDLLVCEGGEVGRTAIWRDELDDIYYQKAVHRLRPIGPIDPKFVLHYMHWAANRKLFDRLTSTTSIAHLTKAKLRKVLLPLPPLDEQKRIAAILDATDALRAKRRESLDQLDALVQSTFLDMFGDPVENPMGWNTLQLNRIASLENGDRSKNYPSGPDVSPSPGILFFTTKNISNHRLDFNRLAFISKEKFDSLRRGKLLRGDLVLTLRGTLGQCALFDSHFDTGFINAQLLILRPRPGVAGKFLHSLISSGPMNRHLQDLSTGVAVQQLTSKLIGQLEIPLPPLALQEHFVNIIETIERQKARLQNHLGELDDLFACLQQRAFAGEL